MVYLTLYFRHSGIQPYLFLLTDIKNPSNILLLGKFCLIHIQAYSKRYRFKTNLTQIQGYLYPQLVQARYVSFIFSDIHNIKHIETYFPTFGYISAYPGIFRILAQLDIFMYIKTYSEPMGYSGILRTVEIFSQFQNLI